jgi:(1->4)-alpha-D-glucan 1-alpha-D-glucosylmutase
VIEQTIAEARAEWFGADEGIFDFLRDVLTLDLAKAGRAAPGRPRIRRFAFKVQQFTGPMMAKSLEDTAFYRFHRMLALNEVGGDPAALPLPAADFHAMMRARHATLPHGMTATATPDTKRGEDARARLLALSELAGEWAGLVGRWKEMNARHITTADGFRSPSVAFEYMLYQALIGAWPLAPDPDFTARMQAYALKAAREAKLETSWLNPNARYEDGVTNFVARILDPAVSPDFVDSIGGFAARAALIGALNSLSQVTLKLMMPGVPDLYQGTEFWDCALVDPDNRRPVDFAARAAALADTDPPDWAALARSWRDGRIKLAWTRHLLQLRAAHPDVFTLGDYRPIAVHGADADHVVAFARSHGRDAVIVAVGRWFAGLTREGRAWPDAAFDATLATDGYTVDGHPAGAIAMRDLFKNFPAAALRATVAAAPKRSRK